MHENESADPRSQENQLSLDERCIAEKRKLWLLLEAGSKDANDQFVVADRRGMSGRLGRKGPPGTFDILEVFIAMARMPHPNPVIKAMTLDRSESVLREFGGVKDLARYSVQLCNDRGLWKVTRSATG